MKRLTSKPQASLIECCGCIEESDCYENSCGEVEKAIEKLKEYEDLEEQGRLLKLPCKVGDTVYHITRNNVIQESLMKTIEVRLSGIIYFALIKEENSLIAYWNFDFGKTVFLTRAEAEGALENIKKERRL